MTKALNCSSSRRRRRHRKAPIGRCPIGAMWRTNCAAAPGIRRCRADGCRHSHARGVPALVDVGRPGRSGRGPGRFLEERLSVTPKSRRPIRRHCNLSLPLERQNPAFERSRHILGNTGGRPVASVGYRARSIWVEKPEVRRTAHRSTVERRHDCGAGISRRTGSPVSSLRTERPHPCRRRRTW